MEAGTTPAGRTGSTTIADLCARAAERFGDAVAIKHKVDGEWRDVTFAAGRWDRRRDRPRPHRPGPPAGRARRHPLRHASGVDLFGLRDLRRRRRGRPDLPHQLRLGVRVGRRQLRVGLRHLRGRRAGREDRRRARAPAGAAQDHRRSTRSGEVADAISLEDVRRRRPAATSTCSRARPRPSAPRTRSPSSTPPARPARRRAAC